MRQFHSLVSVVAAAAAVLSGSGSAWAATVASEPAAQAISFAPESLALGGTRKAGLVSIRNTTARPLRVRTYVLAAPPADGVTFEPSSEVAVVPAMVTLDPDREQVIRVDLLVPATDADRTYRVVVEEVPTSGAPAGAPLAIVAVVAEAPGILPLLQLSNTVASHGVLRFDLDNLGGRRAEGHSIRITGRDGTGQASFRAEVHGWSLFVGESHRFYVALPTGRCHDLIELGLSVDVVDDDAEADAAAVASATTPRVDLRAPRATCAE